MQSWLAKWRLVPIEWYLVLLYTLWFCYLTSLPTTKGWSFFTFAELLDFTGDYFLYPFWLLFFLVFLQVCIWGFFNLVRKHPRPLMINPISLLFSLLPYVILLGVISTSISWLFTIQDLDTVQAVSFWHLQTDLTRFGSDYYANLIGNVHQFPDLVIMLIHSYVLWYFVLLWLFFALLSKSVRLFRQFMLSFVLVLSLGLPMWYLQPALSPLEAVVEPIRDWQLTDEAILARESIMPYRSSQDQYAAWNDTMDMLLSFWRAGDGMAISANPSMHVAWGMLMLAFAWRLSLWLGLAVATWQVLNIISTVVLLQHYTIDLPMGALLAVLAIIVSRWLLVFEARHSQGRQEWWFAGLQQVHVLLRDFFKSVHHDIERMGKRLFP